MPRRAYKSVPGHAQGDVRRRSWPARLAFWQAYYETGPGYLAAAIEAWESVIRSGYTRSGVREAAQDVGWTTPRLLIAFRDLGILLPDWIHEWAARHVARYERRIREPSRETQPQ